MLYSVGALMNYLRRGPLASAASSEDTVNAPVVYLSDGHASLPFRANAAVVTDLIITKDLNLVTDPAIDDSTLASWVDRDTGSGASTHTVVGAECHSSGGAIKLAAGAGGVASRTQDVEVRPGEPFSGQVWLRGDGTNPGRARLRNIRTGNFFNPSNGLWQASTVDVGSKSSSSYTTVDAFSGFIESYSAEELPGYVLRFEVYAPTGTGYADDAVLWGQWNWTSVHGHNLWGLTPEVFWSDDGSAWTSVQTIARHQPSFYARFTTQNRRWVRFKAGGTSVERINLGELVVTYAKESVVNPRAGWKTKHTSVQARHTSPGGRLSANALMPTPLRTLSLDFLSDTDARFAELQDELYRGTEAGVHPCVLVVDSEVIFGRFDPVLDVSRDQTHPTKLHGTSLFLQEDGYAFIGR